MKISDGVIDVFELGVSLGVHMFGHMYIDTDGTKRKQTLF